MSEKFAGIISDEDDQYLQRLIAEYPIIAKAWEDYQIYEKQMSSNGSRSLKRHLSNGVTSLLLLLLQPSPVL